MEEKEIKEEIKKEENREKEEEQTESEEEEEKEENNEEDDDDTSSTCSSTISTDEEEYNSDDSCSFTDSSDSETQADIARHYQEIYSLPSREKSRRSATKKLIDYSEYFDSEEEDEMEDEIEQAPVSRYDLIQQWTETRIEMVCNHAPESKIQDGTRIDEDSHDDEEEEEEDQMEDGEELLYLIKWSGLAHIHNTWHKMEELEDTKGYKRVQNYEKKRIEERLWRKEATDEEIEQAKVMRELDLQIKRKWTLPERIIGRHPDLEKMDDGTKEILYIVKWSYLPYNECTFETKSSIINMGYEEMIYEFENLRKRGGYARRIIYHRPGMFKKLETQPSYIDGGILRDYQLEGVNWLHYSWARSTNIIMADEMGLGKTIQTISFLKTLYHKHQLKGPFLVVVPLSTISGWLKELKKWGKGMRYLAYIGNGDAREIMREFEFFDDRKRLKFNILLTTYEMVIKDEDELGKIPWAHISVDEAHRLKNDANRLYQSLINFEHNGKLLITGTPLQNTLRELWCLLHFLEPNKFREYGRFERKFGDLKDKEVIASLHKALEPHILRREKHDVEKSLPQKIETVLRVSLTTFQKEYYKWILTRNFKELNASGHATSLLNIVVDLKKVCNHPFLFMGAREQAEKDMEEKNRLERIIASSGKLILLDKLLTHLKQNNHRVLIFSQMVRMLNLLSEYLSLKGYKHQRLDGNTSAQHRMQAVDHFNAPDSEDFVFLLSTRAGGLGINLATADTVIIFDSDWNPQADLQAEARAHRIGQTKVVNIYRFVSKFSVEEKILEAARQKRILDHLVIQRMDTSGRVVLSKGGGRKKKSFTKEELSDVLKFGAEGLFENANDENNEELTMSIDDIIAAGERVKQPDRQAEDKETENKSLMSFKVANFVPVGEKDEDLNKLSDAVKHAKKKRKRKKKGGDEQKDEFWQKLFPDLATNAMIDTLSEEAAAYQGGKRTRNLKRKNYADQGQLDDFINEHERRKRIAHFTISQTRTFIEHYKQFPDPERCNDICEMANISRTPQEAAKLVRKLLATCRRGLTRKKESNNKKTKYTSVIRFNGISIDAKEILKHTEQFEALQNTIHEFPKRKGQINPRQVLKWPVKWTEEEDYELLRGILKHGIGNWESIRVDPEFNLMQKICPAHSTAYKRAQPSDIRRRVDTLLRVIENEYERVEDDDGEAYEFPEGSDRSSRRSRRRSSRKRLYKEVEMPTTDIPCAAILSNVEDEIEMMASIVTSLYEGDEIGNALADQLPLVGDTITDVSEKGLDNSRKRGSTIRRDLWNYVASKIGIEENLQVIYENLKDEMEDDEDDSEDNEDEMADDESDESSSSTRKRSPPSSPDETPLKDPRPSRKKRIE